MMNEAERAFRAGEYVGELIAKRTRKTHLITPFSFQWHDDADLDGHCEMPINAQGDGPEMDDEKVVVIMCWCWRQERCEVIPPRWP